MLIFATCTAMQVQFTELEVPLKLQWKHGEIMATGMSFYPQAIVLKGRVYVGGGDVVLDMNKNDTVAYYDIEHNQWAALPHYRYVFFAMAAINEELVLIGGVHPNSRKTTTEIQAWDQTRQQWAHRFNLRTARNSTTAVIHENKWFPNFSMS